jgi:tRNA pseudouridine13 synthase
LSYTLPIWAYAYGLPAARGKLKAQPIDFIVEEILPFKPEGSGEHVFLQIQKQSENTEYVARLLARIAGVRQRDIGFAGLKDRHAVTTQWFSVWLPGKACPDWSAVETENIKVLQKIRHPRKLKRGVLSGNHFTILIRDFSGNKEKAIAQLEMIKMQGFPNYFGEQRFGNHGQNINTALTLFAGAKMKPEQRSIYLSAARSYLFNLILSERVKLQNWNQAISGDVCMINQSNSYFKTELIDQILQNRIAIGEIHPTACLYGKGENMAMRDALAIEQKIIDAHPELIAGLLKFALEMDRRALRGYPENLHWQYVDSNQLQVSFFLAAGSYATALLRELIHFS